MVGYLINTIYRYTYVQSTDTRVNIYLIYFQIRQEKCDRNTVMVLNKISFKFVFPLKTDIFQPCMV